MKLAGLNPMLAYQKGGASGAAGAGIPAVDETEGLADTINTAISQRRAKAEISNLEANAKLSTTNSTLNTEKLSTERAAQSANMANSALSSARAKTEGFNQSAIGQSTATQVHVTEQQRIGVETAVSNLGIADAK